MSPGRPTDALPDRGPSQGGGPAAGGDAQGFARHSPSAGRPFARGDRTRRPSKSATGVLIEALKDEHPDVRAGAANSLRRLGPLAVKAAIPVVAEGLRDGDPDRRVQAMQALFQLSIGNSQELKSLRPVLREAVGAAQPEVRSHAFELLTQTGPYLDRETLAALVPVLNDDDSSVRIEAAMTLAYQTGRPEDEAARPALIGLLKAPRAGVRTEAVRVLGQTSAGDRGRLRGAARGTGRSRCNVRTQARPVAGPDGSGWGERRVAGTVGDAPFQGQLRPQPGRPRRSTSGASGAKAAIPAFLALLKDPDRNVRLAGNPVFDPPSRPDPPRVTNSSFRRLPGRSPTPIPQSAIRPRRPCSDLAPKDANAVLPVLKRPSPGRALNPTTRPSGCSGSCRRNVSRTLCRRSWTCSPTLSSRFGSWPPRS